MLAPRLDGRPMNANQENAASVGRRYGSTARRSYAFTGMLLGTLQRFKMANPLHF